MPEEQDQQKPEEKEEERSFNEADIDAALERIESGEPRTETPVEDFDETPEAIDEPSGDDETSAVPPASVPSASEEADEWYANEDIRQLAASYEIDDKDLKDFGSEAGFRHLTRLIDQKMIADPIQAPPSRRQQPPADKPEGTAGKSEDGTPDGKSVMDLNPEDFDDDTATLLRATQEMQRKIELQQSIIDQQAEWQQKLSAAEKAVEEQRATIVFHQAVDAMNSDLFGRTVDENGKPTPLNKVAEARREQLWHAAEEVLGAMYRNAVKRGQQFQLPPMEALVRRAENYAFGEELNQRSQAKFREQVAAQSRRRRPAPSQGRRRPASALKPAQQTDDVSSIATDPDVMAFFEKASEAGVSS